MKTLSKLIALTFTIGLLVVGCKPEQSVNPKDKNGNPDASLSADGQHLRPGVQCMTSIFAPLVDGQGNLQGGDPFESGIGEYGTTEFVNDDHNLYLLLSMGYYWLCSDGRVWVGQPSDVPLHQDGRVNWESFAWGSSVPLTQYFTWTMPITGINLSSTGTATAVVCLEGVQSDFYGNAFNNTRLWARGTQNVGTNAFGVVVNPAPCPYIAHGECYDVNPAVGRNCTDIKAIVSTATSPLAAPFTFTWYDESNNVIGTETNSTGTASKSVCAAGTYYVTVKDSRSIYTDKDTILVGVNTCGTTPPCSVPVVTEATTTALAKWDCTPGNSNNRKVNVCHVPPGNPGGRHTICIDYSALPAHVIDFKPANNRCLGHVSGCHIGPCDPCGPGTSSSSIARAAAYAQQYSCH